ncbi:MAG TPA: hypothetical protein P5168_03485 [Candidatus Methanomethylicus sp.]|nr:hypothetical protein [Candidatus Methanomethylicus sp.]
MDWIAVAGGALTLVVVASLVALVVQHPFQAFGYGDISGRLLPATSDLGPAASQLMWDCRSLDVVAQAFAILAAAIACLAMLRSDREVE